MVREVRTQKGLRQGDLAVLAKVGSRFITDLEKGKPTLQAGKLFQVLAALEINLFGSWRIGND